MGYALAEACASRGAEVVLVSGPVTLQTVHPNIQRNRRGECGRNASRSCRCLQGCGRRILCAAVADFTPEQVADQKIKREKDDLVLRLKPTCDIAASLGKEKRPDQLLVGFALETCDEVSHAQDKLTRKNFDFIVLNSLNDKGAGFRCDTNKITIIDRTEAVSYPLKRKQEVAEDIVDKLSSLFHS